MRTVRISATVRFFGAPFESNLGVIRGVTAGGIGTASFGGSENPPTTLWSAATAGLASAMDPEFSAFDTHSEVASIAVNAPVELVYAHCARFAQLPRFITSVREVQQIDDTHFLLTSRLDGESKIILQIVLRIPERRIAWQATSDSFLCGVVLFEPLSDRMTEVTVKMRSSIEKEGPAKVAREYLANFKRFVEEMLVP
jgi:uncharacterized membrane protein